MREEAKISKKILFEKVGYTAHGYQTPFHNSEARFRIPCCGRRFGKSQMVGHDTTHKLFVPDSYIWLVGPKYKTGEKEFRVIYDDIVRKLRVPKVKKSYNVKQGDMRIEMPWNTILEVVSADNPDSLVGEGLDHAVMCESAIHSRMVWDQYIEPALSDKLGSCDFPSTPRGNNWYKGMWMIGQMEDEEEYQSWRFPTWFNEVMYPGGFDYGCKNMINGQHIKIFPCKCNKELCRIFNKASEMYWRQEYGAEFTAIEGKIYPEFDETIHVQKINYNPMWTNWNSFDFGFADPFVCLDIMVDAVDNVYVWREYYKTGMSTYEHATHLLNREQPEGYHVDRMAADPRGADEIATLELVLHHYVEADAVGWGPGVEAVKRWLKKQPDGKPKLFIDPSCHNLIRQLGELHTPTVRAGREKNIQSKPGNRAQHDYDDHGPDCLRYFFNQFEVQRGGSLADVQNPSTYTGSEAQGFFNLHTGVIRDEESKLGYFGT
jgi:hypothetical protein